MDETHEERLNEILKGLSSGSTREELAQRYQLRNHQSLDQYMRRRGYRWDKRSGTYVKRNQKQARVVASRALDIIAQFRDPNADAKDIAKRLRFPSHHDMAQYMQARGYVWSTEEHNYIPKHEAAVEEVSHSNVSQSELNKSDWDKYSSIFSLLIQHEDKLTRLLEQTMPALSEVPRYLVPGVYTVKSVHMVSDLNELVKRFSKENNISQREVFEIALIDFFKNYGFGHEIDLLLSK
ncbi:hypothetical protein NZD89_27025 [Alicyclobacillus fastidiosus]|uniref:Uncharacterized protein n=1 Tax=Alicyclobacillus fastidiosus TaxID=392011 RepID=A0ABY6ZG44_9BACL|nr:hypothetical protein [Alicyclobacillus fastidiosus]WAH41806.1 hypothetical protein NZD89_26990 [Alicyclobacillus fastidiosus]WAH41813.1 hypothetical protein NZD89_27025 [Alicyclobacillus fastidiosus]GMA63504.1 hypothetical protein GCM10025859_39440 [Alicyclobacillus fastidiosus]GMA63511.1 hypothetical protein GCM10025859_39510 [Alicyclobacillus fastidiosus]